MPLPVCANLWPVDPKPGDYAVVPSLSAMGSLIGGMEYVVYHDWRDWDHVFVYLGNNEVGEAAGKGFRIRKLAPPAGPAAYGTLARWSTGTIELTDAQRTTITDGARKLAAANHGKGVGYSYLDYLAIAAHHWHIPAPGLQSYISSTGHMICSQAVDWLYEQAGVHLFSDGRWPGDVTPEDMARVLWYWPKPVPPGGLS